MRWELRAFDALTVRELYGLLRLRQDVFIVEQKCAYADADGADDQALHLFAVEGDELVACARLFAPGVRRAEAVIGRVATAGRVRKLGVGRELMRRAIDALGSAARGGAIWLGAQKYLERFYESFGFVRDGDDYDEDDIPHLPMRRPKNRRRSAYDAGRGGSCMRLCVGILLVPVMATGGAGDEENGSEEAGRPSRPRAVTRGRSPVAATRRSRRIAQSLTLQPKNPVVQVRLAHCLAKPGGAAEAKQMLHGARRRARGDGACWRCRSSAIWRCSRATSPAPSRPTTSSSAKAPSNVDARMALLDALEGAVRRRRRQGARARARAGARS